LDGRTDTEIQEVHSLTVASTRTTWMIMEYNTRKKDRDPSP